jgi:hypothetical protein
MPLNPPSVARFLIHHKTDPKQRPRVPHVCRISILGEKMVRKIGQIIRRGPKTWLVRIYVGRDRETRRRKYVGKFIHGGLRSAWPTSTACSRSGTSSQHPLLPANRWPVPRSLARHLRSAAVAGEELPRLLESARTVRPSTTWRKTARGDFAGGNSDALQRVAEPEALGTHDSLHACGSLLVLEAGGSLETPPH